MSATGPSEYRKRSYRNRVSRGHLAAFEVRVKETDLWISAHSDLTDRALRSVFRHRHSLEEYILQRPDFLTSFSPLEFDPFAPPIICDMLDSARTAGVGPMASVAGAIAQYVGLDLLHESPEVIVENGGDIFVKSDSEIHVGVFAGNSPLSNRASLKIIPEDTPLGICTSSATVGPSVSLGRADAVCVVSKSAALADAAATAVGNTVKSASDITTALDMGMKISGVLGVLIILGDKMGVLGKMELV